MVVFTGRADLGITAGVIDFGIKTISFYYHERLWSRIRWGKIK